MKQLVYKIALGVDPNTADVKAILAALRPFGQAEIVGSNMRKVEEEKR